MPYRPMPPALRHRRDTARRCLPRRIFASDCTARLHRHRLWRGRLCADAPISGTFPWRQR